MKEMIKQLEKALEIITTVDDQANAMFHAAKDKKSEFQNQMLCKTMFRLRLKTSETIETFEAIKELAKGE